MSNFLLPSLKSTQLRSARSLAVMTLLFATSALSAVAQEMPSGGLLYFADNQTYVGTLQQIERNGRTCLRGTRDDSPDRELLIVASRNQDGNGLMLSFVNMHRGQVENTGYVRLGGLEQDQNLGYGNRGMLYITHKSVNGQLQAEAQPQSAAIFIQAILRP